MHVFFCARGVCRVVVMALLLLVPVYFVFSGGEPAPTVEAEKGAKAETPEPADKAEDADKDADEEGNDADAESEEKKE